MSDRVFPATPRRRALARRAGVVARSQTLVAGGAWVGAVIGLIVAAGRGRDALGSSLAGAASATDASSLGVPTTTSIVVAVCALAAPVAIGALAGAVAVHLAQTRGLLAPRRAIPNAPAIEDTVARRAGDVGLGIAHAAIVGGVATGWIWIHAPDLGALAALSPDGALIGGALLAASALAHLAGAIAVAGVIEFGVAALRRRADLRMTRAEADEDARAAGIDPRWPRRRPRNDDAADAVKQARLVVIGDGAVAIRFEERVAPRPTIVARGRGLDEARLIALARRHRVPLHRAPSLARRLSQLAPGTRIPDDLLHAIADLVASDNAPDHAARHFVR
jgi:flagellar biosynthesis protein FlhB